MNAGPVNVTALETSVLRLWAEFLAGFFDGEDHPVGSGAAVRFPRVTLRFQQAPLPQPLDGAVITMTWLSPGKTERRWGLPTGQAAGQPIKVAATDVTWLFWVRAKVVSSGSGNSVNLAQEVADKLYGLLANEKAVGPLAQKGIQRLRPETPYLVSDAEYALRLVPCHGRLRYQLEN
jgi:hypothetical protein